MDHLAIAPTSPFDLDPLLIVLTCDRVREEQAYLSVLPIMLKKYIVSIAHRTRRKCILDLAFFISKYIINVINTSIT